MELIIDSFAGGGGASEGIRRALVTWLRENFGHGAAHKKLPAWAFGMSLEFRQALLAGYLGADGHQTGNLVGCDTVSRALAFSIKTLAATMGEAPMVYCNHSPTDVIEGRQVLHGRLIIACREKARAQGAWAFPRQFARLYADKLGSPLIGASGWRSA